MAYKQSMDERLKAAGCSRPATNQERAAPRRIRQIWDAAGSTDVLWNRLLLTRGGMQSYGRRDATESDLVFHLMAEVVHRPEVDR